MLTVTDRIGLAFVLAETFLDRAFAKQPRLRL